MTQHPQYTPETHPDWAIEEALLRGGYKLTTLAHIKRLPENYPAVLAHAYDIARWEKPPVDKAALILADYYDGVEFDGTAGAIRNGHLQRNATALRAALKKNGIEI